MPLNNYYNPYRSGYITFTPSVAGSVVRVGSIFLAQKSKLWLYMSGQPGGSGTSTLSFFRRMGTLYDEWGRGLTTSGYPWWAANPGNISVGSGGSATHNGAMMEPGVTVLLLSVASPTPYRIDIAWRIGPSES